MGFLQLPNEITLLILEKLSKARLKRTRLVCKKLAQIGAPLLMDVLYISPRSKDMEVFDAVTQNPAFSSAIKNIVYDCAQWVDYSIKDYFNALSDQFRDEEYKRFRSSKNAVYESSGLFTQWLSVICGIWSMTMTSDGTPVMTESDTNEEVCDGHQSDSSDLKKDDDYSSDCSSSYASSMEGPIEDAPGLRIDGTRSVGSPLAWTWHPERLQPPFRQDHFYDREKVCGRPWNEWSFVYLEFILVTQMLKSANKQPLSLRVPGNVDRSESISPDVLTVDEFPDNPFLYLACHLKKLELSIASLKYGPTIRLAPNLGLLIDFLKRAKPLTWLNLRLPVEPPDSAADPDDEEGSENEGYSLFQFVNVFPPLSQLQLNGLTNLMLYGLEITYRDLAGLLFLKLPNLKTLALSYIQLVKGAIGRISSRDFAESVPWRNDDEFLYMNSLYITSVGPWVPTRHPALEVLHEPDNPSGDYLERLNETLDKVRKSIGT
ncbi:MAG: hypothetical protein Q9200_006815 [Gallowayella weberi]